MRGFSFVELMLALAIALVVAASTLSVFRSSERLFHDQYVFADAQQSARTAASQIGDEIRMAGQNVPLYSATFDGNPSEATATVLSGSDSTRLNVRAGLSNAESN